MGREGERERGEGSQLVNESSKAETSQHTTLPLYLDHLRVIKPPAEESLDQREHLLQHNDHLKKNHLHGYYTHPPWKRPARTTGATPTGFCVLSEEVTVWLDAPSKLSACLLTSRVVKRLDSIPRMWMMDCLLVGLGCQRRGESEEQLISESSLMKQHVLQSQTMLFGFKLHLSPQNFAKVCSCLSWITSSVARVSSCWM